MSFDTSWETSYHVFKMAIFSKFFGAFMTQIIRLNKGKKMEMISELFIKQKEIFKFVSFLTKQSLLCRSSDPQTSKTNRCLQTFYVKRSFGSIQCVKFGFFSDCCNIFKISKKVHNLKRKL